MSTKALTRNLITPSLFDDFLRPWNEWFDKPMDMVMTIPAVNVKENKDQYMLSLAAPGLKKEDFFIDIDNNMIVISSEKEEKKEENDEQFTRKEYSFSSFTRRFTIPDDVKQDAIEARYENGVLNIKLPRKEEAKGLTASKRVAVN